LFEYKKIGIYRHIFINVFNFGFFENSFSWHRADILGQRERERERERGLKRRVRQKDKHVKAKGDFLEYAKAPLP